MSNTPDTTRADTPTIPDPSSRPTITIDEAATLLGVCRASMYQAAREGQCPTVRIGRQGTGCFAVVGHDTNTAEDNAREALVKLHIGDPGSVLDRVP